MLERYRLKDDVDVEGEPAEVDVRPTASGNEISRSAPLKTGRANDVSAGQQAWQRLKGVARKSWEDWVAIGKALVIGRDVAMEQAHTNEPSGKGYNQHFHNWLERHGFEDIDGTDRSRLFRIMGQLDAIQQWRAGLTEGERQAWCAPSTVWRVSHCSRRGLPAFRKDKDAKGNAATLARDEMKLVRDLTQLANKSARDALFLRKSPYDETKRKVGPALLGAIRDAVAEWTTTLGHYETLLAATTAVPAEETP